MGKKKTKTKTDSFKELITIIARKGIIDGLNEETKMELFREYFKGNFGYLKTELQIDLIKNIFPNKIYNITREQISAFFNALSELPKLIYKAKSQSDLNFIKDYIDEFLMLFDNPDLARFLNRNTKIVEDFVSPSIERIFKSNKVIKEYILGKVVKKSRKERINSPVLYFIEDFLIKLQTEKIDIQTFKEIIDSVKSIDTTLVKPLILLFENDDLFEFRKYDYGRQVYEFKDKNFQDDLVIMLIKEFLKVKQIREVFFDEISAKRDKLKELADLRLFEVFLDSISSKEFEYYFKDSLEIFGDIFLNLMKKYGQLKLSSYWTSSFWFDFNAVYKKIGEFLSPFIKKRILNTINQNDYEDLLFLLEERLFHALNRQDAIEIFNNSRFDFIEYILNYSKEYTIDPDEEVTNVMWYFQLKLDNYVSKYIKKSIIKIVNKNNYENIEGIIKLGLHDYIDNELLNSLFKEASILYVETFYNFYGWYNPNTIKEYFNDESRKDAISKIIATAFLKALQGEDERGIENISQSYIMNYLSTEDLKIVSDKIREFIEEPVQKGDEQEIKKLFFLGFFDHLSKDGVSSLVKNLDFVELLLNLRRYGWDKFHEFYNRNEQLLNSRFKHILIKKLRTNNLRGIFNMWYEGWLRKIPEEDFCDILKQEDLHFLERLLKSVYFYGKKKEFEEDELVFIPLLFPFINMPAKIRDLLKPHVIEVMKNCELESLIPLLATQLIEILNIHEILSIFKDPTINFMEIFNNIGQYNWDELCFFGLNFFRWVGKFCYALGRLGYNYTHDGIEGYFTIFDFFPDSRPRTIAGDDEYVIVSGNKFIINDGVLDLHGLFLQDLSEVEGIFSLKTVKRLILNDNWLIEIPKEIEKLKSLEELIIKNSKLQDLPDIFSSMKKLKKLDVRGNYLRTLPQSLLDCTSIEKIKISKYKYHDFSLLIKKVNLLKAKNIQVIIEDMHFLH